ncbi:hypothetical protein PVK06_024210 [Gossypium arboreum]|uniref:Uroporphyrinogen decarboxylase (URO-D) domain-containing protein n=1 Tax=Gossypium arboreum TaxID=29729 RepID=A0ABR0PDK3_GOSAR|nr:hypothetical protein PVK06_024210 [Gossypium arboreum]
MFALSTEAVALSKDLNGHRVIQYCLKNFSDEDNKDCLLLLYVLLSAALGCSRTKSFSRTPIAQCCSKQDVERPPVWLMRQAGRKLHEPHIMGEHLRLHGIIKEYKYWIFHGESIERTSVQTDQTLRTSPSICTLLQDNEADLRDLIMDALGINIPTLNEIFDRVSSEFQNNGREYDVNEPKGLRREQLLF